MTRGSVAKGRLQCQGKAPFACGVGRTKKRGLERLEGLTAENGRLQRQEKTSFACGVGGTKKRFGRFGGFDGWQKAGFNAKKKVLGSALVPLPAGLGVPKRGLEPLRWALVLLPVFGPFRV